MPEHEALPFNRETLRIAERALHKAQTYARLVVKTLGNYECLGFLLGDPQSDIVIDVLLAPGQRVTCASVVVDGPGVLAAGREIADRGLRALGWFHSHGLMEPFHSGTDDANTEELLGQLAPCNLFDIAETLAAATDGAGRRFFLDGEERLELVAAGDAPLPEVQLRRTAPVGFAYSLVVNALGDKPHAELYTKRWCPHCRHETISRAQVSLEILPDGDEEQLVAEIRERVTPAGPRVRVAETVVEATAHGVSRLLPMLRWGRRGNGG